MLSFFKSTMYRDWPMIPSSDGAEIRCERASCLLVPAILWAAGVTGLAPEQFSFLDSFRRASEHTQSQSPPSTASRQTPPAGDVLQVQTRVVTVEVVARDAQGAAVRDLQPEEFEISDDGPQKIAHFALIENSQAAKLKCAAPPMPKGFT
jgi:hypothetical protein